jgi:hypothetical protein
MGTDDSRTFNILILAYSKAEALALSNRVQQSCPREVRDIIYDFCWDDNAIAELQNRWRLGWESRSVDKQLRDQHKFHCLISPEYVGLQAAQEMLSAFFRASDQSLVITSDHLSLLTRDIFALSVSKLTTLRVQQGMRRNYEEDFGLLLKLPLKPDCTVIFEFRRNELDSNSRFSSWDFGRFQNGSTTCSQQLADALSTQPLVCMGIHPRSECSLSLPERTFVEALSGEKMMNCWMPTGRSS